MDAKKTVGYVDWSLLLLIGSALGLSKGIVNSGLANYVGGAIRDSGISADGSLFVLYAFTMVSRSPSPQPPPSRWWGCCGFVGGRCDFVRRGPVCCATVYAGMQQLAQAHGPCSLFRV